MEDAVILGNLFSRLKTESQIPIFVNAFQELRQQRCMDARLNDEGTAHTYWFPPGPARDARNAAMAMAATEAGDGKFVENGVCCGSRQKPSALPSTHSVHSLNSLVWPDSLVVLETLTTLPVQLCAPLAAACVWELNVKAVLPDVV